MTNESTHRQDWGRLVRILRSCTEGSITLEIYRKPQGEFNIEAYICNLMVEEPFRRQGIGNELLAWAEDAARREGYDKVYLEWHREESSQMAFDWYLRHGYNDIAFGDGNALLVKKL